jgi:head-tail adaptor
VFTPLLTQRAWLQTPRPGKDRFNQPIHEWDDKAINIPCRLRSASGRERQSLAQRGYVDIEYVVYMDANIDVDEGDRILRVVKMDGNEELVLARDLDVALVRKVYGGDGQLHHIECPCRVIRSVASA